MNDFMPPWVEGYDQGVGRAEAAPKPRPVGRPSNDVYARVGDIVLRAAREGVRGGMRPDDIIRQIVTEHNVRLNLGDLRLLLASRRIPDSKPTATPTAEPTVSELEVGRP